MSLSALGEQVLIVKYTEMVRGKISRADRSKLVALVTIEVHARDILDKLQVGLPHGRSVPPGGNTRRDRVGSQT